MRSDLIPAGAELLALALLARGQMTAPLALVAYRIPKREIHPFIVHIVNLKSGGRSGGGYYSTAADAMEDFTRRLTVDLERRILKGVPLTKPGWISGALPALEADADSASVEELEAAERILHDLRYS